MNLSFVIAPLVRRMIFAFAIGFWLLLLWLTDGLGLYPSIALAASQAETDPSRQPVTVIKVTLGNAENELKFVPDVLEFTAGKRYKLLLSNPSQMKHYFTAKNFADVIWSQKVEAGQVEVKGAIHELELKPSASAEWFFIPQKSGRYELHCSIPGHAEAGMKGTIVVHPIISAATSKTVTQ